MECIALYTYILSTMFTSFLNTNYFNITHTIYSPLSSNTPHQLPQILWPKQLFYYLCEVLCVSLYCLHLITQITYAMRVCPSRVCGAVSHKYARTHIAIALVSAICMLCCVSQAQIVAKRTTTLPPPSFSLPSITWLVLS